MRLVLWSGCELMVYYITVIQQFFRTVIVPLTVERVLATIRSKNYEQQQSPLIGVLAVLLTVRIQLN